MRLYKLDPAQLIAIQELNESRENTLLIICDHDDGDIGIDADALKDIEFLPYLLLIAGGFDEGRVSTIELDSDGRNLPRV